MPVAGSAGVKGGKLTCAKCKKFLGRIDELTGKLPNKNSESTQVLNQDTTTEPVTAAGPNADPETANTAQPTPAALETPATWLYVSKRLDVVELNNTPLTSGPVIFLGDTPYYRLTPGVFCWIESAGEHLASLVRSGKVPRDQLAEFSRVHMQLYTFAARYIGNDALTCVMRETNGAGVLPAHEPREVIKRRM